MPTTVVVVVAAAPAPTDPLAVRDVPVVDERRRLCGRERFDGWAGVRLAVLLAAFVGLRKGELLGLQRRDVDLDQHELRIERQRQLDSHGQHLVGHPRPTPADAPSPSPPRSSMRSATTSTPTPNPATTATSSPDAPASP